jgi:GT2 family glycosyltransferase
MRTRPTVSVVLIAQRNSEALGRAIDSVVAQDYRPLEIVLLGNGAELRDLSTPEADGVSFRTGATDENRGVAGGRNAAARLATGDWLLFLDDDALLRPGAAAAAVAAGSEPGTGAVAFRVIDPDTGATAVWFYPEDATEHGDRSFDVPWVVGGGNLIRRDLFESLHGFWDGYFREMEEIDFSWRLLDAGWRIRYEPLAAIEHPERTARLYRHLVPSNILMLWRLLPLPLALRVTLVRLPLFAVRAIRHREVGDFVQGLRGLLAGAPRVARERHLLSPATVEHLRALHTAGGPGKRLQWSLRPRRLNRPT